MSARATARTKSIGSGVGSPRERASSHRSTEIDGKGQGDGLRALADEGALYTSQGGHD